MDAVRWQLAWCVALVAWVGAGCVGMMHGVMLLAWGGFGALGWCGLVGWCARGALLQLKKSFSFELIVHVGAGAGRCKSIALCACWCRDALLQIHACGARFGGVRELHERCPAERGKSSLGAVWWHGGLNALHWCGLGVLGWCRLGGHGISRLVRVGLVQLCVVLHGSLQHSAALLAWDSFGALAWIGAGWCGVFPTKLRCLGLVRAGVYAVQCGFG